MSSENKRREVAKRIRQLADAHAAVEASCIARALSLEYKVYGTVVAFDSVDVHRLADLIDPTCHVIGTTSQEWSDGSTVYTHELSCGHTCRTDWPEPPAYCDECGARVIDDGR